MTTLDTAIFRLLNDGIGYSRIAVELAYFLADYAPTVVISVLATYFFLGSRRRDNVRPTLLVAFLAAGLAWTTSALLVDAFFRPRPFTVVQGAHLLISSDRDSSFPNVTTTWFAAVAVTMMRIPNRLLRVFFVVTAMLFGASRPILGDHWPSDILVSWVLGGMASLLVFKAARVLTPIIDWFLRAVHAVEQRWLE